MINANIKTLAIEYLYYRLKNDYEPSFEISELFDLVDYLDGKAEITGILSNPKQMKEKLYNILVKEYVNKPGCFDMEENKIKANYRFNLFEVVLNQACYHEGDKEEDLLKLRELISEYLKDTPKRKIQKEEPIKKEYLEKSQMIVANMIYDIYMAQNEKLESIDDINIIKKSMQKLKLDIFNIYYIVTKRLAILYQENPDLMISSLSDDLLANSNYRLITSGFEEIFNETYNYKKAVKIDLSEKTIQKLYPKFNEINEIEETSNKTLVKKLNELEKNI